MVFLVDNLLAGLSLLHLAVTVALDAKVVAAAFICAAVLAIAVVRYITGLPGRRRAEFDAAKPAGDEVS